MSMDNNRLLLEIDAVRSELNRQVINPLFSDLTVDALTPVMTMVAHARAAYLRELFDLPKCAGESATPQPEQIQKLKLLRIIFEELVSASQAMETAIERGYLDVKG